MTQYIQHRINTIEDLRKVPQSYGVELDVRADEQKIYLHHDILQSGEFFEEYLSQYSHKTLIVNTKCEGMEDAILALLDKYQITDFFFLDLSIPFMVKTLKKGCSKIAVRYSEYEPIEFVDKFRGKVDWVWVDCFTKNVLTAEVYQSLKKDFKICIVSPELQAHPLEWIDDFKRSFEGFEIDAVCTKRIDLWQK